jgi:hypothetical protein
MVGGNLLGNETQISKETVWFPKNCNDVAGQIHPILKRRENGFDLRRLTVQPGKSPLFTLLLAAHRRLPCHSNQINGA